jgi:hypothetical protein
MASVTVPGAREKSVSLSCDNSQGSFDHRNEGLAQAIANAIAAGIADRRIFLRDDTFGKSQPVPKHETGEFVRSRPGINTFPHHYGDVVVTAHSATIAGAGEANNRVHAGSGDTITAAGKDTIFASGSDLIHGDKRPYFVGSGGSTVFGGSGGDKIAGGTGPATLAGSASGDRLFANRSGPRTFDAGSGKDPITGNPPSNTFLAGFGNATITAAPAVRNVFEFINGQAGGKELVRDLFSVSQPSLDHSRSGGAGPAQKLAAGGLMVTLSDGTTVTFQHLRSNTAKVTTS